jgi:hypothetical protein
LTVVAYEYSRIHLLSKPLEINIATLLINGAKGAKAENVIWWALGTAATVGAGSVVAGSVLAGTAITFGTGSELQGCALAKSAVMFASNGSVEVLYNAPAPTEAPTYAPTKAPTPVTPSAPSSAPSFESVSHSVCENYAVRARTAVTFAGAMTTIHGGDASVSLGTAITGAYTFDNGEAYTFDNGEVVLD